VAKFVRKEEMDKRQAKDVRTVGGGGPRRLVFQRAVAAAEVEAGSM